jgi:ATP-binding cassette subfamily F protein uup
MVSQRGRDMEARSKAEETQETNKPSKSGKSRAASKAKMTFKDKYALETLPGKIKDLEKEIARLGQVLADATLYTRDPNGFEKVTAEHGAATDEMATAEEEWLRLEMLREEIDNA